LNELKPIYEVLTKAIEFQEVALDLLLQYDNLANFKIKIIIFFFLLQLYIYIYIYFNNINIILIN